jgi:hypothetical protein
VVIGDRSDEDESAALQVNKTEKNYFKSPHFFFVYLFFIYLFFNSKMNWPFWRITEHRDLAALKHALDLEFL